MTIEWIARIREWRRKKKRKGELLREEFRRERKAAQMLRIDQLRRPDDDVEWRKSSWWRGSWSSCHRSRAWSCCTCWFGSSFFASSWFRFFVLFLCQRKVSTQDWSKLSLKTRLIFGWNLQEKETKSEEKKKKKKYRCCKHTTTTYQSAYFRFLQSGSNETKRFWWFFWRSSFLAIHFRFDIDCWNWEQETNKSIDRREWNETKAEQKPRFISIRTVPIVPLFSRSNSFVNAVRKDSGRRRGMTTGWREENPGRRKKRRIDWLKFA